MSLKRVNLILNTLSLQTLKNNEGARHMKQNNNIVYIDEVYDAFIKS